MTLDKSAGEVVAEAWTELLGAAPTGPGGDFFTVGGDSLKAIRLVASIQERTGVELPFRVVFDHPTYGELVELVRAAAPGGVVSS